MSGALARRYAANVNRGGPSERMWAALKQLAQSEQTSISHSEAIKRVKAVARKEGAYDLPDPAIAFYASEYCEMVAQKQKSG